MIMSYLMLLIGLVLAYLLGSINPAYFLGKWLENIDIREKGNKNAGAINAWKVLGKIPGLFVGLIDIGKGVLVVVLASLLGMGATGFYLMGVCAIAGHAWPFYLKWRGGVGAAVTIGLILGLFFYNFRFFVVDLLAVSWVVSYFFITKVGIVPFRGKRIIRKKRRK